MNKNKWTFSFILLLLCVADVGLLYQSVLYKKMASNELLLRQRAEWTTCDIIRNVGKSVLTDSVARGRHFILRYDSTTCLACIVKAENLLNDVFGEEYLAKELCYLGVAGQVKPPHGILLVQSDDRITPMDEVYTPYFCVVNDNGDVLFTLSLIPDNHDYNHALLTKIKKTLEET